MSLEYESRNGLLVAISGPVVIEGVRHRVASGFVFCNRSINGWAWNVTAEVQICRECYPGEWTQRELEF